jgi:hypothetical protein
VRCKSVFTSLCPSRRRDTQWLFYFNPRFGLYFVESVIKGEPPPPGIFGWMSAAWVLALGLLLLSGRPLIKAYVISEVALSAPTLLFVFVVALANLSPAHGFPVGELSVPVCLMIIFSVVPSILAHRDQFGCAVSGIPHDLYRVRR